MSQIAKPGMFFFVFFGASSLNWPCVLWSVCHFSLCVCVCVCVCVCARVCADRDGPGAKPWLSGKHELQTLQLLVFRYLSITYSIFVFRFLFLDLSWHSRTPNPPATRFPVPMHHIQHFCFQIRFILAFTNSKPSQLLVFRYICVTCSPVCLFPLPPFFLPFSRVQTSGSASLF